MNTIVKSLFNLSIPPTDNKKEFVFDDLNDRLFLGKHSGAIYLTKREVEVLRYVLIGSTTKQIGRVLQISFRTVEKYIEILKDKLCCELKRDLIKVTIENGLFKYLDLIE